MKDTAVKFLIDEISCRFIISMELRIAMSKAIRMEKEQMQSLYSMHIVDKKTMELYDFDEYYNETFKSE